MVVIRTDVYPDELGKVHALTHYQVGETMDFTLATNVLDEVMGDANNKMLNTGVINLIQPENTIWYGRFKRHFQDGTSEDWHPAEPIYSADLNNNRFIKYDSSILVPSIKVVANDNGIQVDSSLAIIEGADGHLYSNTLLYSNGKLIYKDMENKENLNSLFIPITALNHKLYNNITVMVAHGTVNNAESPYASTVITNSKLKFNLAGNYSNIPYNKNQKYILTSTTNQVVVADAKLYNGAGADLGELHRLTFLNNTDGLDRYSEIHVDSEHFAPSEIYTLRLTVKSTVDATIVETYNYIITTEDLDQSFVIDRDYVYTKKEIKTFSSSTGALPVSNALDDYTMSYQSSLKDILLSSNSLPNSLSVFKFYPNTLELKVTKDINLDIATTPSRKVVFFKKNRTVIIVEAEDNNTIKLIKCAYNPFDNTKLIKESTISLAIAGAFNIVDKNAIVMNNEEDKLYYMSEIPDVNGKYEFGRISIADGSKELLASRPSANGLTSISFLNDDKIVSVRGGMNLDDFYIYSIGENLWTLYKGNYPLDSKYVNCINTVLRKDGKINIFSTKNTIAKNYVVLDVENKTFTTEEVTDLPESYLMDNIIRQADGSFILVASNTLDKTDKALVYIY